MSETPSRQEGVRGRWRLVLLGTLLGVILAEVGVRAATGTVYDWQSPDDRDLFTVADPATGRIPRPGISFRHPKGYSMHMGAHGVRINGNPAPPAAHPVTLAVGDSFAFGDQVDDSQSWPADLERLLGSPVVNAGVPGFGIDQAVLRAEQLDAEYAPDTIVLGFIPHDVLRCQMSFWSGRAKPYFTLEGETLTQHPAPPVPSERPWWKRLLAHSAVLDRAFVRELHWDGPDVVVHDRGADVACRLAARLDQFGRSHHARVLLVAYPQRADSWTDETTIAERVVACARDQHVEVLDLLPEFARMPAADRDALFHGHFSVRGNQVVAEAIARALRGNPASP